MWAVNEERVNGGDGIFVRFLCADYNRPNEFTMYTYYLSEKDVGTVTCSGVFIHKYQGIDPNTGEILAEDTYNFVTNYERSDSRTHTEDGKTSYVYEWRVNTDKQTDANYAIWSQDTEIEQAHYPPSSLKVPLFYNSSFHNGKAFWSMLYGIRVCGALIQWSRYGDSKILETSVDFELNRSPIGE